MGAPSAGAAGTAPASAGGGAAAAGVAGPARAAAPAEASTAHAVAAPSRRICFIAPPGADGGHRGSARSAGFLVISATVCGLGVECNKRARVWEWGSPGRDPEQAR